MIWVDYVILGIIALSALISLVRGFAREVLSIVVWVAAFWLAIRFAKPLAPLLEPYLSSSSLRIGATFVLLFVGTLLLGAVVNFLLGTLIGKTGLSGTDRVMGVVFGAGRGLVIVVAVILILGLTPVPREPWWQDSVMIAELTPWVCQVGVEDWMGELTAFSPVAGGGMATAVGTPVASYWSEFCAGAPAGHR